MYVSHACVRLCVTPQMNPILYVVVVPDLVFATVTRGYVAQPVKRIIIV